MDIVLCDFVSVKLKTTAIFKCLELIEIYYSKTLSQLNWDFIIMLLIMNMLIDDFI